VAILAPQIFEKDSARKSRYGILKFSTIEEAAFFSYLFFNSPFSVEQNFLKVGIALGGGPVTFWAKDWLQTIGSTIWHIFEFFFNIDQTHRSFTDHTKPKKIFSPEGKKLPWYSENS
jgi:hypothetical protein